MMTSFIWDQADCCSTDVYGRIGKAWSALHKLDRIWKSDLSDALKTGFFRATVETVLLHGSTHSLNKKLDGAYTQMLRVAKDVTWRQRITNEALYAGLPRISTTIKEKNLRFSGHCWTSKNEVPSDVVLWEPKHGKRNVGGQACTFVDLLEADTGVPRDCLPAVMDDRVGWRKRAMGVD